MMIMAVGFFLLLVDVLQILIIFLFLFGMMNMKNGTEKYIFIIKKKLRNQLSYIIVSMFEMWFKYVMWKIFIESKPQKIREFFFDILWSKKNSKMFSGNDLWYSNIFYIMIIIIILLILLHYFVRSFILNAL